MISQVKEKIKGLEESARLFVEDENAQEGIDIGYLITLIITIMVAAIVLGALLPTFAGQIANLQNVTESIESMEGMGSMIELIPMLVVLIFVISIIVVLITQIKKGL